MVAPELMLGLATNNGGKYQITTTQTSKHKQINKQTNINIVQVNCKQKKVVFGVFLSSFSTGLPPDLYSYYCWSTRSRRLTSLPIK